MSLKTIIKQWLDISEKEKTPKSPPDFKSKPTDSDSEKTTRSIALRLLNTFVTTIFVLFATNIALSFFSIGSEAGYPESKKDWFELLKNSMILLGTALTTVIGYYFGQRDGKAQASKEIEIATGAAQNAYKERDGIVQANETKGSDSPNETPPALGNTHIETP